MTILSSSIFTSNLFAAANHHAQKVCAVWIIHNAHAKWEAIYHKASWQAGNKKHGVQYKSLVQLQMLAMI